MAVDKHPSRAPAKPYKPPATSTTSGGINKETHSGQAGVHYGFRHELQLKNPNRSELSAHITARGEASHEGTVSRAGKVGDTKKNGEPG